MGEHLVGYLSTQGGTVVAYFGCQPSSEVWEQHLVVVSQLHTTIMGVEHQPRGGGGRLGEHNQEHIEAVK